MDTNQHSNPGSAGPRIFLLGFMGTGKSHWGKQWAGLHNMSFFDLDELIEKAEEDTVANIFEKAGEEYFRVKEASILRDLINIKTASFPVVAVLPVFMII